MSKQLFDFFRGELLGTFVLVFLGCGSVAMNYIGMVPYTLFQVASVWGIAVVLGITISRRWCHAHLNPAVTFAVHSVNRFSIKELVSILAGQFVGAILAGIAIFILFNSEIREVEEASSIIRGELGSYHSAVMFGEFYPNPGFEKEIDISMFTAFGMEFLGVMGLMMVILGTNHIRKYQKILQPILIGIALIVLIYIIAPYTQAGFNPFRDFGPRLVAYFSGWGDQAFPKDPFGFLVVYILAPILSSVITIKGYYFIQSQLK